MDLRDAIRFALIKSSEGLLRNPKGLKSYLMDWIDLESVEMRVLIRCCDKGLLEPLAALDDGATSEDLEAAGRRMAMYLREVHVVDSVAASQTAEGIVAGYAAWKGIGWKVTTLQDVPSAKEVDPVSSRMGFAAKKVGQQAEFGCHMSLLAQA